jgi:methionyl-tRNA formyltransferase
MNPNRKINFIFFGSSRFSEIVLDELEKHGFLPMAVVTTPDKPQGRKLVITPTPVKRWATKRNIKIFDPAKLDKAFSEKLMEFNSLTDSKYDLFVVASYGKIIPESIYNLPSHKTLNIHPSLLPKYRGPSPLQSTMLDDVKNTGITVMRIDAEMDHGPIVSQTAIQISEWPTYDSFEEKMAREGAKLLAKTIPDWCNGKIKEKNQDNELATYTSKINKKHAEINLADDPYMNFRKIQAYHEWPQAYFFVRHNNKKTRVKISSASFQNGELKIEKVIPEGGREMKYDDFLRGYANS